MTDFSAKGYFANRVQLVNELGIDNAFPHKYEVSMNVPQFKDKFKHFVGTSDEKGDEICNLAGRLVVKRNSGQKIHFWEIQDSNEILQIVIFYKNFPDKTLEEFKTLVSLIKRSDIIGVTGCPGTTKNGEFSIFASKIILLTPCFHMLPENRYGFTDTEQRYRQRYLDFIINKQNTDIFITRSKIIKFIRKFFDDMDFVEVETPILNTIAGGATARPFITHHNELNQKMFMRISPELYLKMLVVGGMNKVYELGRQFRNEGIDRTHNPEFTSIETYSAYQDYNDLMIMTENLLANLSVYLYGKTEIEFKPNDEEMKIFDFSPPYKRLYVIPELEKRLDITFPEDFDTDDMCIWLQELCKNKNIEVIPPFTTPRLFDALISEILEPECVQPTFICDHPRVMSPLAKWHRNDKRLTERFELFVNKKELCNAYTELNNPLIQRHEFEKQIINKNKGDDEAMSIDEDYIRALEYGLPPCGGWGLGIDRLVMLLTNNNNIREVLLFPTMK